MRGRLLPRAFANGGLCPFAGTGRRGKLLLVCFEKGACLKQGGLPTCSEAPELPEEEAVPLGLAFHLKMSGRLFAYPAGSAPEKHTRLILHLDDGGMIFFDDARKFGYARALTPAVLRGWDFWNKLGPEPFRLDDRAFAARFRGRKSAVKSLLLDQSVIAGIGNIYADESCFRAGIRPDAPASSLSFSRLARLRAALVEVLEESIEACGSSIKDYRTARGDAGAFQNAFRVYGRRGKNCLVCGSELRTCRVAGRTTTFCPTCRRDELLSGLFAGNRLPASGEAGCCRAAGAGARCRRCSRPKEAVPSSAGRTGHSRLLI